MCHKEGLPILLTRYAVATKDSRSFYEDYQDVSEPREVHEKFREPSGKFSKETPAMDIFKKRFNEIINAEAIKGLKASEAPDMQDKTNFKVAEQNGNPISLGEHAYYTLRLLRPGFVYVYNPKAPELGLPAWRGYHVTGGPVEEESAAGNKVDDTLILLNKKKAINRAQWKGIFMMPFDVEKEETQGKPQKVAPCKPQKNWVSASCITISPEELATAETIWISYSDVKWSPDVLEQYANDTGGCRTANMRAINIKQYGKNRHAASIDELAEHVAEYSEKTNIFAFDFATIPMPTIGPFYEQEGVTQDKVKDFLAKNPGKPVTELLRDAPAKFMIRQSKKFNENAFFVALDDPAGIAADLAELMDDRFDDFLAQPTIARKYAASTGIVSLRTAVHNQADLKCIETAKENRENYYGKSSRELLAAAAPHSTWADAATLKTPEDYDDKKYSEREKARNYEENPYAPYTNNAWEEWQRNYDIYGLLSAPAFEIFREASWKRYQYDLPGTTRFKDFIGESFSSLLPIEYKSEKKPSTEKEPKQKSSESEKKRFDDKVLDGFVKEYEARQEKFRKNCIDPLALAHATWMRSPILKNYFKWHFESENPLYGVEILNVLGECIGGTQDNPACAALYEEWLNVKTVAEAQDDSNLIWKGLLIGGLSEFFPTVFKALDTLAIEADAKAGSIATENKAEAKLTPTVGTPKTPDVTSTMTKAVTGKGGAVEKLAGKGSGTFVQGALDTKKNWKKVQSEWKDPKAFDVNTLGAMPLLMRTYETFKFLVSPLTDVAIFVLRVGETPAKNIALKTTPAEYLNKLVGGWLNKFLIRVSGPAARICQSSIEQGKISPILYYMSAADRQIVTLHQIPGTARDLARSVVGHVIKYSTPDDISVARLTDQIEDRMQVLQAEAMKKASALDATQNIRTATTIPFEDLKKLREGVALYAGMTDLEKADYIAFFNRSMKSVPIDVQNAIHEGRLQDASKMLGSNRQVIHHGGDHEALKALERDILKFQKKSHSVVRKIALTGTFQGLLSWASLASALNGLNKAYLLEGERFDAWGRLVGAAVSSLYMISTALADLMQHVKRVGRLARLAIHPKFGYKFLKTFSEKLLFKGAARILGGLDIIKGIKRAFFEDKGWEGAFYIASGVVAIASTFGKFAKGSPMVILFLTGLALLMAIEIVKDDDFQAWLSKCCFGYDDPPFRDMTLEIRTLEEAGK
jgi:hypothetical protein